MRVPAGQRSFDVTPPRRDLARRPSPERSRLDRLRKEHDQLLRAIGTKRRSFERWEAMGQEAAAALVTRTAPLDGALRSLAAELRAHFEQLLSDASPLSGAAKRRVRALYRALEATLPESARADEDGYGAGWARGAEPAEGAPVAAEVAPATARPGELLRATFRRLAVAMHPDRTTDTIEKTTRTEAMKEITRAFERADVARLVELERTLLANVEVEDDGDLKRRIELLERGNDELRRQLRAVTEEAKARRAEAKSIPTHEALERSVRALEREVENLRSIRDLLRAVRDGRVTVDELLGDAEFEGMNQSPRRSGRHRRS